MTQWLQKLKRELRVTLTRPGSQLTRGQRFLRLSIDLGRHARKELRDDSATTMAAALTYRTIFGLVPMIVMALIVFNAFGGFADSKDGLTTLAYDLLDIELRSAEVSDGESELDTVAAEEVALRQKQAAAAEARAWLDRSSIFEPVEIEMLELDPELEAELARERANAQMKQRIDDMVGVIAEGATSIKIGSIGVVGMLILIWAALGLIVTVEKTFNIIYHAPQGRPWHVRIPIYWAIITLGPVLIWGSFYLSTQFIEVAEAVPALAWLVGLLKGFSAVLVSWLLFLLLFKLMPNAQVAIRPAMAGAMVSALAWELMKAALRWYIDNAVMSPTQSALYGSLALIPILLFWVYLSWLVVLAGLEVTHILQTLPASRVGRFEKARPAPVARDPWLVIPVMSAVAQAFDAGKTIGIDVIAKQLDAPPITVAKIADELIGRGLLHRLADDDGAETLSLAMPPGKIRIAELIATEPEQADLSTLPGHALLMQLAKVQDTALADVTLEQPSNKAVQ